MRIMAVRHGVTPWNAAERWQGTTDIPLADEGVAQAFVAAKRLATLGWPGRHVFCSTLSRSLDTATTICAELKLEAPVDIPDLGERDLGEWEGLSVKDVEHRYPGSIGAWTRGAIAGPPGGETDKTVAARFARVCTEIRASVPDEDPVLVVTHAGVLHAVDKVNGLGYSKYGPLCGRWFEFPSFDSGGVAMPDGLVDLLSDVTDPTVSSVSRADQKL